MTDETSPLAGAGASPLRGAIAAGFLVVVLALLARPTCAGNQTVVQAKGFSISIPADFHVETDHKGTVLAGVKGETPPFIVIYYADSPASGDSSGRREFDRFRQSSIANFMGDAGKKMLEESEWHHASSIDRRDGVHEERLDVQVAAPSGAAMCAFMRFYHNAPHVEVYLAGAFDCSCAQAQPTFDAIADSIVWK